MSRRKGLLELQLGRAGPPVYVSSYYDLLVVGKRLGVSMLLVIAHYGSTIEGETAFFTPILAFI